MNDQKFYTIQVIGVDPADVTYGELDKQSMQPKGELIKGKIEVGFLGLPNYSKVWGKRGEDKGKPNGKIEFLKWGNVNGEAIEIRYLPNSFSLDKQYQENVQKLKVQDKDAELNLKRGINKFDYSTQGPLIEMLKHHTFNGDNESRDPDNRNIMYSEYNPTDRIKSKSHNIATRRLAEEYVMNCEGVEEGTFQGDRLENLAHVFGLNLKDTHEVLYDELLDKVKSNPAQFILVLQTKRDEAKLALVTAHESGFADFTQDGEVSLREGAKKKVLIKEMESFDSVDEKLNHIVKNFTDPEYYKPILEIQAKVKEFQTAQLQ